VKDIVFEILQKEKERQQNTLMMIASENYTYNEVRDVVGSVFMHKYAEGQPGKRYYQGNQNVDEIERICQSRALAAFGLDANLYGANVQALSGSPANLAVISALLEPGEKILSMDLPSGGHLSHGWKTAERKVSLVSKVWDVEFYGVDEKTDLLDYAQILEIAKKVKPKLIISGGTAYPREIDYKVMSEIAREVGAYYLADVAHEAGLIAGGAVKSPFGFADVVTMTTHKTLRGPRGAIIIAKKELIGKINSSVFPGLQGGPHLHTIAGIAIALEKARSIEFAQYATQTVENAKAFAMELKDRKYKVISGGTDKHLVLVDLKNKEISGWHLALALEYAGIITNRNSVPFDSSKAYFPSGIRIGTQALTVRGMKEKEMMLIADLVDEIVELIPPQSISDDKEKRAKQIADFEIFAKENMRIKEIREIVKLLCQKFPIDLE
jgi:glycine hydroxymethyltransferase